MLNDGVIWIKLGYILLYFQNKIKKDIPFIVILINCANILQEYNMVILFCN